MKKLFQLFLLLAVFMLASCAGEYAYIPGEEDYPEVSDKVIPGVGSSFTEQTDEYSVTYQYRDNVTVFPDSLHSFILGTEEDSILYLSGDMPGNYIPEVGDVWSARSSDKLPYGLAATILSVEKTDDGYKVVTTFAPLDEIFSELKIQATSALEPLDADSRATIGNEKLFKVKKEFKDVWENFDFQLKMSGGWYLLTDIDLANERYDMAVNAVVDWEYKMGFIFDKEVEKTLKEFPEITFKPLKLGPVVVVPHIRIGMGFKTSGKAECDIAGSNGLRMSGGYQHGKAFGKTEFKVPDTWLFNDFNWGGEGEVVLRLDTKARIGIYTKSAAVSLNVRYELGGEGKLELDDPNLLTNASEFKFGIHAHVDASVETKIFSKDYNLVQTPEVRVPLFEKTWSLLPKITAQSPDYVKVNDMKFTNSFNIDGGLLCNYMEIWPVLGAFKDGKLRYQHMGREKITDQPGQTATISLERKESDKKLTLCPGISFRQGYYYAPGMEFIFGTEPAIRILKVVPGEQSSLGDTVYRNFYVYFQVSGIESVREFDLVFSEPVTHYAKGIGKAGMYVSKCWAYTNVKTDKIHLSIKPQIRLPGQYAYGDTFEYDLALESFDWDENPPFKIIRMGSSYAEKSE